MHEVKALLEFFREHQGLAKAIAQRGYEFVRVRLESKCGLGRVGGTKSSLLCFLPQDNLRMEDVEAYWQSLLQHYAKLQKFQPQLDASFQHMPNHEEL